MAAIRIERRWIPAHRAAGVAVDLAGTGTAWTTGTTFTLSGVSGATIKTKVVASATAARLVIATGAAVGALTISDGSGSATVAVLAARMPRYPGCRRKYLGM